MLIHLSCSHLFASVHSSGFYSFLSRSRPISCYRSLTVCRNASSVFHGQPARSSEPTVCENDSTASLITHSPPTSAYLHLPFCRRRCYYCDFPVIALGTSGPSPDDDPRISNYAQLLCNEIESTPPYMEPLPLQTVFFGGGTPSLTPPRTLRTIIQTLSSKFGLVPDVEMSMEIDPGTFDANSLRQFIQLGVNRLSLGVQAFQDEALRLCGRSHGLKEVYEAIDIIRASNVENWSLDLISSLPHQTAEDWKKNLEQAIQAQPSHISVYDLQIEEGTKFGNVYQAGEFPLPSEYKSAEFYRMAHEMLTGSGYVHYEISNYCKEGFECKHNLTYWTNQPYYGFGLGSTSYVGGVRFTRPRRMRKYAEFVEGLADGESENGLVLEHKDDDAPRKERAMDIVMLSLRLARGLDIDCFAREFGWSLVLEICRAFQPYVESGHVTPLDEERRVVNVEEFLQFCSTENGWDSHFQSRKCGLIKFIRLSDPDGFLLSNEIISTAFKVISP
ncbi:uncharacterized protein LOC126409791 [Nymphaea colorata]|uniref:Radical S-adenosyl methionine domain-containing protein 1, mitochondrial n=1 Tax=Nymphaea colorata TaxID=210225 RepID=A0A5K0ZWI3_9MAGN|nr:uncharacterized protein LOC126409791 [Nymphaea colorata]